MSKEVHSVWAQVRQPRNESDLGQVTAGYYTLADDVLTMTDSQGAPIRDLSGGEKYVHKLKPGEDARMIASRLTMQIYRMRHGDGAGRGRINYPPLGIV